MEIKTKVFENQNIPKETFVDNADFIRLMKISKRTAQVWRDEGVISFSQVGNKIYYKFSDIEALLKIHEHKPFRKFSRNQK
jgi:3-methyladenine DNA glycosylase Tag